MKMMKKKTMRAIENVENEKLIKSNLIQLNNKRR